MTSKTITEQYNEKELANEDNAVLQFLSSFPRGRSYRYLEAGAGLGRFPLLLHDKDFKNIDITCLEINKDLVEKLSHAGLSATVGSVLELPFPDEHFDVVHASHIVEHFGYPDITRVLDELFRVAKRGGHVVVRSPLLYHSFYNDIDHIRPYPPKSILQYFNHEQQQKKGTYGVRLESEWFRRGAWQIESIEIPGISRVNTWLQWAWLHFNFPRSDKTGYVAVFQKI